MECDRTTALIQMTVSISKNVYNSRRMDEEREVGTGSEPNQGGSESEPSQIRIGCGMRLRLVSGHQMKKNARKEYTTCDWLTYECNADYKAPHFCHPT